MRAFQLKYYQILLLDVETSEFSKLEQYHTLFSEILNTGSLKNKKIFQAMLLNKFKVTSNPITIQKLLHTKELPPFQFLICKN